MKINTKTKKSIIFSIVSLVFLISSAISFAAWDASPESNNCDGQDCRRWHNEGITHQNYPYGTDFATFNNYADAIKADRPYKEMQFMYIESELAQSQGFPTKTPWESYSNYNFNKGVNHTINFKNNNPVRIGFWGYIHNNGEANKHPATGSQIKISEWNSSTPKTSYTPKYTLWADNIKPKSVWANVGLSANVPFTLHPVEAYIDREDGTWQFNSGQLQSITTTGIHIKSNKNNSSGKIDSSELHYILIYTEFEATPQKTGACNSLTITDPDKTTLTVDENGFVDKNLTFTVDTDPNVVSGYQVHSNTITFDKTGKSDIKTHKTSIKMNDGPNTNSPSDTVQVWALDKDGNGIQACHDSFNVRLEQKTNECKTLETTPAPPGVDYGPVPLNEFVKINIDKLVDTNNNPYLDNGAIPQIRYCYTNNQIKFLPDSGNYAAENNGKCAVALSTDPMNIIASQEGTMNIEVVDAKQCHDSFETKGEETEGQCVSLKINQSKFTADDSTYSVNVETNPYGLPYDVEWFVDSAHGDEVFDSGDLNGNSIDLNDYNNYHFTPGDTLVARATDIKNPNNVCMDRLTSEEKECTIFTLDRDKFEPETDQEVCVDTSDWPLSGGDNLEYSIDEETQADKITLNNELCFVLTEKMTRNANSIRIWVPEWENPCVDELKKEINPPKFSKNASSIDDSSFSHRTIANFSDDHVDYEITYTHYANENIDTVITDTIGTEGYIQGYIAGTQTEINENTPKGGQIYYADNSMRIYVAHNEINDCSTVADEDLPTTVCYNGNIENSNGVEIKNLPPREEVVVKYTGNIVDSKVNPESCSNPESDLNQTGICGEIYPNTARFHDDLNFSGSDKAEVIIPCPFIIIRAGGDVFLENPFDYGVDTLSCSEIRTSDTPVIQGTPPDNRKLNKTGAGSSILKQYSDRLCNSNQPGSVDIKGISSLICELELTSKELTQQAIVQNLARNIQLFSRYSKNLNNTGMINGSSNLPESANNVYIKDNGMLTLGGEFAKKTRTIVVLNNNVYINKNLTFKDPESLTNPRKVPSLAVIVIGGNIIIDPSVSETNAIFFVQEGAKKGGQICEAPKTGSKDQSKFCVDDSSLVDYNSKNRLTHYGSIYGDIEHLLKYRVKTGDPTKEEGAILIRFDNRIYLNTPPLLNKLIDITQKTF